MTKNLGELPHGARVEIVDIGGDSERSARLGALGLLPGVRVRVTRVAPLNDPITLEIGSQEISVRRADAGIVAVKEL